MSATIEWAEGTVFMKGTDKKGSVTFTEHRCWNADMFIMNAHAAAVDAGGTTEEVTAADYNKATGKFRRVRKST